MGKIHNAKRRERPDNPRQRGGRDNRWKQQAPT